MALAPTVALIRPLSPRGRGREAMTYGRVRVAGSIRNGMGADVSHLAELVRGYSHALVKSPSSALRAPSPQGEKGPRGPVGEWR
jgi:hypothetical protein